MKYLLTALILFSTYVYSDASMEKQLEVNAFNQRWQIERDKENEFHEEQRRIKEEDEIRWEERKKLQRETEALNNVRKIKTQCKELGFKEGSKKFKDCVVELID